MTNTSYNIRILEKFYKWYLKTLELENKVIELDKGKILNNGKHPIRPKKGEIYMIEFGENIGKELSNRHMAIIMQSSNSNIVSHTISVIPISSSKHTNPTHLKIYKEDILQGKLDILPSYAKVDQITCIDKARIEYKVGEVTSKFIKKLEKKILKNLDIRYG